MRKLTPDQAIPGDTYYVIIGCGVTAAVNYTTLLDAPDDPFGKYEVLFLGQPEPWGEYDPLLMGQWPSILATPSFQRQLESVGQNDFVDSAEFSTRIDDQWTWLYGERPFRYSPGLVTTIKFHPPEGYEVTWKDNGSTRQVYAAHLDICGGPGPSRRLCKKQVDDTLWPYPEKSWRLQTGESYLNRTATLAEPKERVAVIGGGPTGAWCVERALKKGNQVLWVSNEHLNPAFVSSRRNDALAQTPLTRERKDRVNTVINYVFPNAPNLAFAEFYDVGHVYDGGNTVDVVFKPRVGNRHVNDKGWHLWRLRQESFAQVILALGQETGRRAPCLHAPGCTLTREANSWATKLEAIISTAFLNEKHFILKDKMEVGLQSEDGKLRVLGTAFLAHPYADSVFNNSDSKLFGYVTSLTEQAQVNRGAAVATMTTALANGYFDRQQNLNRNGATLEQLEAIPKFTRQYAELLHDIRKYRIHPVTNDEADEVHYFTRDRCS